MPDAPSTSQYLLRNPDINLPNAQALSSLSSGILKNNVDSLEIASPTADYLPYSARLASIASITTSTGNLLLGTNGNSYVSLAKPSSAKTLICDGTNPPEWGDRANVEPAYVLAQSGSDVGLPNRRILAPGAGMILTDDGPGGFLRLGTTGILESLAGILGNGIIVKQLAGNVVLRQIIAGDATISVTDGGGAAGNPSLSVVPKSSVQRTILNLNGVTQTTASTLNFVTGPGVGVSITSSPGDIANVQLTGDSESYSVDFVTLTDNTTLLPSSFPLSDLSTGIVKVTTGTGALSTAVAGTDYLAPSTNLSSISSADDTAGNLLVADGDGFDTLAIGSEGEVLKVVSGELAWASDSSGAPSDATYVVQTASGGLSNEFVLGTLSTGILKVTTTTGALSTAVAGTDYLAPSVNLTSISTADDTDGNLLVANGTGFGTLGIGTDGQVLKISGTSIVWGSETSGAPTDATYIVKTANSGLSDEFALSTLSTGLLKVTTTTGDLSTAVVGTDYLAPSTNLTTISSASDTAGNLLVADGSGFDTVAIGTEGQVLKVSSGVVAWGDETSGAPTDATYIVQTANSGLSNEFALGTLSTGLLKVTTTTGVLTTAAAGTDYLAPSVNLTSLSSVDDSLNNLLVANGSGFSALSVGTEGQSLQVVSGNVAWATPAPIGATYITQTADSDLTNSFALESLSTGSLRVTTGTGVLTSITPDIFVKCVADVLPAYTYSSGVITFTATGAVGSEYTDNVSTSQGDIVLNLDYLNSGGNAPYAGAYEITTKGSGGVQEVWTRVSSFNSSSNMIAGINFYPTSGLVYASSCLTFSTTGAITVGTTALSFISDVFTRTWKYSVNNINSTSAGGAFFSLPAGKVFYPTAFYVTGAVESYTAIPYYDDGSTDTALGSPLAVAGSGSSMTISFPLGGLESGIGVPTMSSSTPGGTQASMGIEISVAALSSDTPTYTIVGTWSHL